MIHPRRSPRLLAVLAVVLAAAVACTNDSRPFSGDASSTSLAPPPVENALIALPPDFEPVDTRGVVLTPLVSEEQPPEDLTIPVTDPVEGEATIRGRVTVNGRAAPARVRVERFVGGAVGVLDLDTDGSGAFTVDDALGGRYRIRAWDAPELSSIPSVTTFVAADATVDVEVPMRRFEGLRLQLALDTAVPAVGAPARLQALLTDQRIDGEGLITGSPVGDTELELVVDGGLLRIGSSNPTTTAEDGTASWQLICRTEGAHEVTAEFDEQKVVVTLPTCLPASAATTTTPPSSSTTSTSLPTLAVDATFTPPYSGALPAGRYVPEGTGCSITYEVRSGDTWTRTTEAVSGEFTVTATVRNPRPATGTTACTYTRTS